MAGHNNLINLSLVGLKRYLDGYVNDGGDAPEWATDHIRRTIDLAITSEPPRWEKRPRDAAWVIDMVLDDAEYFDAENRAVGRTARNHREMVDTLDAIAEYAVESVRAEAS